MTTVACQIGKHKFCTGTCHGSLPPYGSVGSCNCPCHKEKVA